jgi:hypothetical protein
MINGTVNIRGSVVGSTINLGEILGNVTNTVNHMPAASKQNGIDLKPLLEEMLKLIRDGSTKGVSQEDAKDAAAHVDSIARAGTEPQNGGLVNNAKTAWQALKSLAAGFAAVVGKEQIDGVLHKIGTYFGW